MKVENYKLRLDQAAWIDVNSEFTLNGLPDRLPNALAIKHCALYNLLN